MAKVSAMSRVLFGALILFSSGRAGAQPPAPLLVISTETDAPRVPQALIRELSAGEVNGQLVATGKSAADLVRAHASYEKSEQDGDPFDRLRSLVSEALTALAHGEAETARQGLSEVIRHAEEGLDALGRREEAARELLDACLFSARTFLERGLREDARREVFRCRRLVPDLSPNAARHPPEVRSLLAEVDRELPTLQRALRVESTPSGCAVRVNGRELGTTPYEARTPPGFYTLAVECSARGDSPPASSRVHPLILGSEPVTVSIDTRLDSILETNDDRGVLLEYPTGSSAYQKWQDLLELGRSTHVATLIGVSFEGPRWRIDRVDVDGRRVTATAWLSSAPSLGSIRAAVAAIEDRRSVDATSQPERTTTPWQPPASPRSRVPVATPDRSRPPPNREAANEEPAPPRVAIGWSLAALGVATLGTAWALHFSLSGKREDLQRADPMLLGFAEAQAGLDRRRGLSTGLTLGATALLVAAAPLLVPDQGESVSPLAWVIGAAGAVLAGAGVGVIAAKKISCIDSGCTRSTQPWRGGLLILAHATPMLTVPVTALARRSSGEDLVSASATQHGWHLSWQRNF